MSVLIDSYASANQDAQDFLSSAGPDFAQIFLGNGTILSNANFWAYRSGSITGNAYAKIYAVTGTMGSTAVPTGSALATSDPVDVSTLSASYSWKNFVFSGANQIQLVAGTVYALVLEYNVVTSSAWLVWGEDQSSPTHQGNWCALQAGSWVANAAYDFCFQVFGFDRDVKLQKKRLRPRPFAPGLSR